MKRRLPLGLILGGSLVVALLGWALVSRSAVRSALASLLDRHEEEGLGSSFEDLLAGLPPVDPGLQERAWEWLQRARPDGTVLHLNHDPRWYLEGRDGPPEVDATWGGRFAPEGERLLGLLASDRLVLTSPGWIAADAERLAATPVGGRSLRVAHSGHVLELACWLEVRALADRGGEALDALDRLARSVTPSASLHDVFLAATVRSRRDRTHLLLALGGDLPAERLRAWADEPAPAAEQAADAERGHRLLYTVPLARDLAAGVSILRHYQPGESSGLRRLRQLWEREILGPHLWPDHCARQLEHEAAFERFLRGRGHASEVSRTGDALEGNLWPFDTMSTDTRSAVGCVASIDAAHRAVRVAALLVASAAGEAGVPATVDEARGRLGARASLLAAGGLDLGLSYRRLAPGRFRVALDPDAPLPPLVDFDDVAGDADDLGAAPSRHSFLLRGISVEVALR